VSTGDILIDWHPIMIAKIIRDAVGGRHQREIARILGITQQYVSMLMSGERVLSPEIAARLERVGLDGRHLYAMQEKRRVEIQWRYETGEIERPSLLVSREAGEKVKRNSQQNKLVQRDAAVKAARTRKRQKAARAARAEAQDRTMEDAA
jgi:plasmid maintenance system antidote protein VapI